VPDLEPEAQKTHFFNQKIDVHEVCLRWAIDHIRNRQQTALVRSWDGAPIETPPKLLTGY